MAQAMASVAWGLATPSLIYMINLLLQIYPESLRVRSQEPSTSSFLVLKLCTLYSTRAQLDPA